MTEALRDAVPPTMDKAVKEALEPFAKAVGLYDERWPDERRLLPSNPDGSTVTLGDLRRARAALAHLNDSPEPVARPASPAAEGVLGETIDQRDRAEEALSQAYYLVTGRSPEWSSAWGFSDALEEISDAQWLLRQSAARAEKAEAALLARDGEVARLREALGYNAALNTASEDNGQLLDNVIEAVCKTRPDWPWNRTILRKNILAALNPKEA